MIFKQIKWRITLQLVLLFVTLTATAFVISAKAYSLLYFFVPAIIYQVIYLYRFQLRVFKEFNQFLEGVRYRDFSGNFNTKNYPVEFKELRSGFNEINTVLKALSKEKETQYHYLQKIVELVETGILFLIQDTGEVILMNEALQQMLRLPYLKKISSLKRRNEGLYEEIMNTGPDQPGLITVRTEEGSAKVLLSASDFQIEGKKFRLLAFQNVNEVLDETETKAWQKLLSVLTHEIMNSIAPISSLADTLKLRVQQLDKQDNTLEDIEIGIDTIKRRSQGLLTFAETYRNLNKISTLELKKVYIRILFENIHRLMQPMLAQKNIDMGIVLKNTGLSIEADPALIEQVLINLIVNAMEALKNQDNPQIILSAYQVSSGRIVLKVTDNGAGIPENLLDKIFIPFFSTKKNGSGIGLTLCKQIMMLHKATIQIQPGESGGTTFSLRF